jgi:intracellular septation protein A
VARGDDVEPVDVDQEDLARLQSAVEDAQASSFRQIVRRGAPRFASDGLAPSLAFYVGYRSVGLAFGIVCAAVVAIAAWVRARRQGRTGLLAWLTLLVVVIQGTVGLLADDARAFLAPQVLTGLAWGIAFLGSVVLGRPLAGLFAGEFYDFPPEVRASATFRRVFTMVSLAWGSVFLVRGTIRILQLRNDDVDQFIVVSLLTGYPVMLSLMTWSIWWARRAFARSEEWGWALQP